jgi:hypothetical protein
LATEKKRQLPIQNFSEFLQDEVKRRGTPGQLATLIGMNGTRVRSILKGEAPPTISMDVVDKAAVKCGTHIGQIYPDYYEWPDLDDAA